MKNNTRKLPDLLISICIRPRETIQYIVDTHPKYLIFWLVILAPISTILHQFSLNHVGDSFQWPLMFLMVLILSGVVGLSGFYIISVLNYWTGKWIGGKASLESIQAAMAWSLVPIIFSLSLWVLAIALCGYDLFTSKEPILSRSLSNTMMGILTTESILEIWFVIIYCKCLGQVQGFSAWRAWVNNALSCFILMIPIALLDYLYVNYFK